MKYGTIAPPTIDMIRNDAAFLVFAPRFLTPSAKMVGNMIDIKKEIEISAMIETPPLPETTTRQSATLMIAYNVNKCRAATRFMNRVLAKRPTVKASKAIDSRKDALPELVPA